jgi:hypothetical protein
MAGGQQLSHSRAVAHNSLAHRRSARHTLHRRPAHARCSDRVAGGRTEPGRAADQR